MTYYDDPTEVYPAGPLPSPRQPQYSGSYGGNNPVIGGYGDNRTGLLIFAGIMVALLLTRRR